MGGRTLFQTSNGKEAGKKERGTTQSLCELSKTLSKNHIIISHTLAPSNFTCHVSIRVICFCERELSKLMQEIIKLELKKQISILHFEHIQLHETALVMFGGSNARSQSNYCSSDVTMSPAPTSTQKTSKEGFYVESEQSSTSKDAELMELEPFFTLQLTREYTPCHHIRIRVCHGYRDLNSVQKAFEFVCAFFVNCLSNNRNWSVLAKH